LPEFVFAVVLYAVVSLTLVRMLPVAIALAGTGLARSTGLFYRGPDLVAECVKATRGATR
jgi:hypothetical protein